MAATPTSSPPTTPFMGPTPTASRRKALHAAALNPQVESLDPNLSHEKDPHSKYISHVKQAVLWLKKAQSGSTNWTRHVTEDQFWYYRLCKRELKLLGQVAKYGLLLLTIFEAPATCKGTSLACATLDAKVYSMQLGNIPFSVSACISLVLFAAIAFRMRVRQWALGKAWKFHVWIQYNWIIATLGKLSAIAGIIGCIVGIDFLIDIYKVSAILRPLIFLGTTKKLREGCVNIMLSIPKFIDVLVSLALCLFAFVWMGVVLFTRTPEGAADFPTWGFGFAKMWILFTTANSPDVFIPAYSHNKLTVIFFIVYLVIMLYVLGNVLLAKVYDAYKEKLTANLTDFQEKQQLAILHAFDLLCEDDREGGRHITVEKWREFFIEYCDPDIGGVQVADPQDIEYNLFRANFILSVFHDVNMEEPKGIDQDQFQTILSVFLDKELYIPKKPKPQVSSMMPSAMQVFFLNGVTIRGVQIEWDHMMNCVILLAVALTLPLTFRFSVYPRPLTEDPLFWILFVFSLFYVSGLTVKISTLGFERFWNLNPIQHPFDFFNVYGLLVVELVYISFVRTECLARAIILLHMARSLRLFKYMTPLRHLFLIITRLIPTFWQIFMLLLIVYYVFAVLGMWLFGGIIYTSNPALAGSSFASGSYWPLNFNDFVSGLVTLFVLMIVNNWYILCSGYMLAAGTSWASAYFVLFFLVCNLIVLNILIALVLDCTSVLSEDMEKSAKSEEQGQKHVSDLEAQAAGRRTGSAAAVLKKVMLQDQHPNLPKKSRSLHLGPASDLLSSSSDEGSTMSGQPTGRGGGFGAPKYGSFSSSVPAGTPGVVGSASEAPVGGERTSPHHAALQRKMTWAPNQSEARRSLG